MDDTGIVNACFNVHVDKLEQGIVYHMTHLSTELINGSLQVVMSYFLRYLESKPPRLKKQTR